MIFELREESLLPADYVPPIRRSSRLTHIEENRTTFVETEAGFSGKTIQSQAIQQTSLIDTIAHFLRVVLLVLVAAVLLIVVVAILQYYLMSVHIISDPRAFTW